MDSAELGKKLDEWWNNHKSHCPEYANGQSCPLLVEKVDVFVDKWFEELEQEGLTEGRDDESS